MNNHSGTSRPDRFYAQFTLPGQLALTNATIGRDLTYQCHTTELPGVTLQTNTYKTYGIAKTLPVAKLYNEITFSLFCTNDFYEKPLFDSWIEYINPANLGWDFRYKDEYVTTINVCQLNLISDIPIYTVQLLRAYPIAVYPMERNWAHTNTFDSIRVTFVYEQYIPITTSSIITQMLNNITIDNTTSTGLLTNITI